jgi:hypothetical protein
MILVSAKKWGATLACGHGHPESKKAVTRLFQVSLWLKSGFTLRP